MQPLHLVLALLTIITWGLNFVVVKVGLNSLPPLFFSAMRFLFSALPLVFFVKPPAISRRLLVGWGLTQFALQFALLFGGMKLGMPAGLSSLVVQVQAFFTILLAALFFGEQPRPLQIAGSLVSLAGMALVAVFLDSRATLIGFCMVLGAAMSWSAANILTKRMGRVEVLGLVGWGSLVAVVPLLVCSALVEGPAAMAAALTHVTWITGGAVLYQAYANTLFGFAVWSALVARYPSAVVAPLSLLVPVFGMGGGVLLLGEPMPWWKWVAALLVLTGVGLNQIRPRHSAAVADGCPRRRVIVD